MCLRIADRGCPPRKASRQQLRKPEPPAVPDACAPSPQGSRRSAQQRDDGAAREQRSAEPHGGSARRGDRVGLAARPGLGPLLQRRGAESASVPAGAGAHDRTVVLVPRAVSEGPADRAQHRRGRVQPARPGRGIARGRVDARPALPRQRPALRRRSAARRDEPRDARMAAADTTGARSADDDRGSGGRGDRAGAPRRAVDRACTGRRTLAHRPRRPRHARTGIHGRRPAHRSRPVASGAAQRGAAGADAGAGRRPPGPR